MADSLYALGLDPGFATLGWGALRIAPSLDLLALGVLTTDKVKGTVLASDDQHRRGQELVRGLVDVLALYPFAIVCTESMSLPRNASTAFKLGRGYGVIDAVLELRNLALISKSPQAIKKTACGRNDASKDDVIAAIDARFGGKLREHLRALPKGKHEHAADAVGAVLASLNDDTLRLVMAQHGAQPTPPRMQTLLGLDHAPLVSPEEMRRTTTALRNGSAS